MQNILAKSFGMWYTNKVNFKKPYVKEGMFTDSTDTQTILREKILHYTMSYIGGIFAMYALLEHNNVFGSAETSNMILLVGNLLELDIFHILIRIGSLVVYASGIIFTVWMAKYHSDIQRIVCVIIDAVAAVILGLLPLDTNPIVALYPVAFAMSVQWCSFRGVENNPSATTFSTGNFRQLVTNFFNYFTEHKSEYLVKAKFYLFTMLSFHVGVASVYLVWPYIPHYSIFISFVPMILALLQEYAIIARKNACLETIAQNAGSDDI